MWQIRQAVAEDAAALSAVAHAAKRHWGYPERWIAAWHDILTITPAYIAAQQVVVAEADGAIVGFAALAEEPVGRYWLDHCWVVPQAMGRGVGRALVAAVVDLAIARNGTTLWIAADPHAETFYLRLGARRAGEEIGEIDGQTRLLPLLELAL